jgi:hypothetical protein
MTESIIRTNHIAPSCATSNGLSPFYQGVEVDQVAVQHGHLLLRAQRDCIQEDSYFG